MAKTNKVTRQGRRVIPAIRRQGAKVATKVNMTLGDLIAAAYDTVGSVKAVASVLGSQPMARATGRRIVFI